RTQPDRKNHACRAVGDVERGEQDSGLHPRRAKNVSGAEVAATDVAQVGATELAPKKQRKRHRANEVAEEDDERHMSSRLKPFFHKPEWRRSRRSRRLTVPPLCSSGPRTRG